GPLQHRRARLAVPVEWKQLARGALDEVVVPDAHPWILVLHVGVGGKDVPRALHPADLLAHVSSASPSLMVCPGARRSASFTPGPKRTTTVDPISKMASSPPFSTCTGWS